MILIADILMIAGALSAAFYCIVLSRRLSRFRDLEKGIGGVIAVLSMRVDELTKSLERAQRVAKGSAVGLDQIVVRGESAARQLELLLASMHDLPEKAPQKSGVPSATAKTSTASTDVLFKTRRTKKLGANV